MKMILLIKRKVEFVWDINDFVEVFGLDNVPGMREELHELWMLF